MATIPWNDPDEDDYSLHSGPLGRPDTIRMISPTTLPAAKSLLLSRTRQTPDIAGMLISGYGFSIRPMDMTQVPYLLGTYDRERRTIGLDWRILIPPPQGAERLRADVWRTVFDASRLARLLAAWCMVTFATDDDAGRVLPLGFNPHVTVSLTSEKKRISKVAGLVGLLAPRDSINRQLQALGMSFRVGDVWRDKLKDGLDTQVVDVLAEYNNCPAVIIETALDGCCLSWQTFTNRLLETLPMLRMRRYDAMRWFSINSTFNALTEVFLDI